MTSLTEEISFNRIFSLLSKLLQQKKNNLVLKKKNKITELAYHHTQEPFLKRSKFECSNFYVSFKYMYSWVWDLFDKIR